MSFPSTWKLRSCHATAILIALDVLKADNRMIIWCYK